MPDKLDYAQGPKKKTGLKWMILAAVLLTALVLLWWIVIQGGSWT